MNGAKRFGRATTTILAALIAGGLMTNPSSGKEPAMSYQVAKIESDDTAIAWSDDAWRGVEPLELQLFMGKKPAHFPRVQAKIAYDAEAVYVAFHVDDRYVRAVAEQHQDSVCNDSCVEFFFTPGEDVAAGYFNLEMNCGGTMLLHFQRSPGVDRVLIAPEDLERIEVVHEMPKTIDPEIEQPTRWSVAYRLPVDLLEKYFPREIARPAPGVTWRANVYKCADATSHPHWLTWSPVERPQPDFHRPEWFGTFEFE